MKLSLNYEMTDIEGNRVKGTTLGVIVGRAMMASIEKDPTKIVKYFNWAKKLGAGEELDLDEGDVKTLENFVSETDQLYNLSKAHTLGAIDAMKAAAKK